jgi:hypothetical protein
MFYRNTHLIQKDTETSYLFAPYENSVIYNFSNSGGDTYEGPDNIIQGSYPKEKGYLAVSQLLQRC